MITRTKLLTVLALMLSAFVVSAAPADWEEANRLFDAGDFARARTQYEKLLAAGERSANLFFNLGNAHFRLGDAGRAALFYERALTIDPESP